MFWQPEKKGTVCHTKLILRSYRPVPVRNCSKLLVTDINDYGYTKSFLTCNTERVFERERERERGFRATEMYKWSVTNFGNEIGNRQYLRHSMCLHERKRERDWLNVSIHSDYTSTLLVRWGVFQNVFSPKFMAND